METYDLVLRAITLVLGGLFILAGTLRKTRGDAGFLLVLGGIFMLLWALDYTAATK